MNVFEQKLVQNAQTIFGSFEKWNALLELAQLQPQITRHWLTIGTKKLREYFTANPSEGWRWNEWGCSTDTKWFLDRFGFDSLAIGFGWDYEFHLYVNDMKRFDTAFIAQQLKTEKYAKLVMPFGLNPRINGRSGSMIMAAALDYNFGNLNSGKVSKDELAWYAAHETDKFVCQAAFKVEQFIRDENMNRLLIELNEEAESKAKNRE